MRELADSGGVNALRLRAEARYANLKDSDIFTCYGCPENPHEVGQFRPTGYKELELWTPEELEDWRRSICVEPSNAPCYNCWVLSKFSDQRCRELAEAQRQTAAAASKVSSDEPASDPESDDGAADP